MGRARSGTFRQSGQAWLVMVTIPAAMFPPGKLPPPSIDPKTKKQKAHPRRLGVPVPAVTEGRTTTKAELDNLAKLFSARPDLAISRCAKAGKLPSWIPAEMVPSEVLQAAIKANPVAANVPGSPTETVAAYADRWLKWRDERNMASIDRYQSAIYKHILTVEVEPGITLGERPIATTSRADCKVLVKSLRDKVTREILMANTALRYWIIFTAMMASTANDDEPSLYVRDENPAIGIKAPEAPKKQTRGVLYVPEFLQLVACEKIPLGARRVIVLAVYLQMRSGELSRIRCEDVDLEHEIIHVRRGWDSYRKKEKQPKNGTSRTFDIPPNLLPLLRAMIAERGGKGLLSDVNAYRVSEKLDTYLDAAGLHRWELRTRTPNHIPLIFHGLRATGATWAASVATNPLKLRHMLGHADQSTTDRYIEASQLMGKHNHEVFPVLPESLVTGNSSGNRIECVKSAAKQVNPSLLERERPH